MSIDTWEAFRFRHFRLLPTHRTLLANGEEVTIGGRALDVLLTLARARGHLVSKDAIMESVWPNLVVDDNTLQFQIFSLRRALGDDRDLIKTVSGRGYQLAAVVWLDVESSPDGAPGPLAATRVARPNNIPPARSRLIGREGIVAKVADLLGARQLVTLVGPGGIGKSALALAVARELLGQFEDGVWFIELGALTNPELAPSALVSALGLSGMGGSISGAAVARHLANRHILLVIDNCEHLIDAAAAMIEDLLGAGAGVHVLATSREALRVEGEHLYRVPPLDLPDAVDCTLEEVLAAAAVRLFVTRVQASDADFSPTPDGVASIANLCRRLDGSPLAIELAAARATSLGIDALETLIEDRFRLLAGGRRTAVPRHQTLQATLDWSYDLLPDAERRVLNRVAIFAGSFTAEGVRRVVVDDQLSDAQAITALGNLVSKSLVSGVVEAERTAYRLLETTRVYARLKLAESGDLDPTARKHAEYCVEFLEARVATGVATSTALVRHGRDIDEARAALDWAHAPGGDPDLAARLTIAAIPAWTGAFLTVEGCERCDQALAALAVCPDADKHFEATLRVRLWQLLLFSRGPVAACESTLRAGLEVARSIQDVEIEFDALWGLCVYALVTYDLPAALALAREFKAIADQHGNTYERILGHRTAGVVLGSMGDNIGAREEIETAIALYEPRFDDFRRLQWSNLVAAYADLATTLWLLGLPDQAVRASRRGVAEAIARDDHASLAYALNYGAIDLFLGIGDLAEAEAHLELARDMAAQAERQYFATERRHTRQESMLAIARGDAEAGVRQLIDEMLPVAMRGLEVLMTLSAIAEGYLVLGQAGPGLERIEEAIAIDTPNHGRYSASLLCIKGDLLLLRDGPKDTADAEACFMASLEVARRQGALLFELRAAVSLARLMGRQGRGQDGRARLSEVYGRFTEGFETQDLRAAKALLDELCRET